MITFLGAIVKTETSNMAVRTRKVSGFLSKNFNIEWPKWGEAGYQLVHPNKLRMFLLLNLISPFFLCESFQQSKVKAAAKEIYDRSQRLHLVQTLRKTSM